MRVKVIEPALFKSDFTGRSLAWAAHPDYEPQAGNMRAWVAHGSTKAPDAGPVAETIFKAATDASDRLRYPVRGGLIRAIHAVLPDAIWRALAGAGMNRRPKASAATPG